MQASQLGEDAQVELAQAAQGYLAHKKQHFPRTHSGISLIRQRTLLGLTEGPCLGSYGSLGGGAVSYERGTPIQ